jgi:hypothetical protein
MMIALAPKEAASKMEKEAKKRSRSTLKPSAMTKNEVVSSNIKRERRDETTFVSTAIMTQKPIKAELTPSLSRVGVSARQTPTPAECHLVVRELGTLHPDVISNNVERRGAFAFQRQQANGSKSAASRKTETIFQLPMRSFLPCFRRIPLPLIKIEHLRR